MALYSGSLLLIDRMVSVTHQRSRRRHRSPSPPGGEWHALTLVTHHNDAVDGCPCIGLHLNNRPLLSLLLAKFASSTSSQKPHATYTRFLGGDLYASIYGNSSTIRFDSKWKKTLFAQH